jgi:hypothetical protein
MWMETKQPIVETFSNLCYTLFTMAHPETHKDVGTHLANGYKEDRKRKWMSLVKGGLVLLAGAGIAFLALQPWTIPASVYGVIKSVLGTAAIVGAGIAGVGGIGRAAQEV